MGKVSIFCQISKGEVKNSTPRLVISSLSSFVRPKWSRITFVSFDFKKYEIRSDSFIRSSRSDSFDLSDICQSYCERMFSHLVESFSPARRKNSSPQTLRPSPFISSPRSETVIIRLHTLSAYHILAFPGLNSSIIMGSSSTVVSFDVL